MPAAPSFDLAAFVGALEALGAAFVLGGLIGLERQYRQRSAGLRTMVLVAVGAAAFVHLGGRLFGDPGRMQIIAYVVSGIGFLGAGVIMKEGLQVRGLNTAATLWATAAVGACAGAGLFAEAAAVTVFVLGGNTLLRPLVDAINRRPLAGGGAEALYQVTVTSEPGDVSEARELLYQALTARHYPIQEIETLSESDEAVELAATLVQTSAEPAELDALVVELERDPRVQNATWTVSALA
ncbi:MAG TPA: MgtC/SapB family protein [Caulobacteraceae bacterium]|nr:MgtC/SapB family protein [Caulobacteraceae bacterium]